MSVLLVSASYTLTCSFFACWDLLQCSISEAEAGTQLVIKGLKISLKSLRGAKQHMLPKSYLCARIQNSYVKIRKLVFLLFSGDLWDLPENWKYEEASCNPYQPAVAVMLMQYLAVLEQRVRESCQKPFSKGTLAAECARCTALVIPWASFCHLKKDAIRDGRASAGSLAMFFEQRQPSLTQQLVCFCFVYVQRTPHQP